MKTVVYPHPVAPGQADLQGLSSMVTASEQFQPQQSVPCNSRSPRRRLYEPEARSGLYIVSKKWDFLYYRFMEEYTKKLANLRQFYTKRVCDGGGGGSRTPVRKYSTKASTYIARFLFSPQCLPPGRARMELTCAKFRFAAPQVGRVSEPASRRPVQSRRLRLGGR